MDGEPEKVLGTLRQRVDEQTRLSTVKQTNEQILVCVQDQAAGEKWIDWHVGHVSNVTYLSQTVFFSPRGLPGFLYWYLLYPFHMMEYRGLIQSIIPQSKT